MSEEMCERILLAHGGGGILMKELVGRIVAKLGGAGGPLQDSATLPIEGGRISFTTDSFVVSPLFFPGGDIGRLAVCGTVNDLAMSGARPVWLSLSFIIEEGLTFEAFDRILDSIAAAALEAGVVVATGDTKVVERGKADGIFINTSGIGVVPAGVEVSSAFARSGDAVLINGGIGEHGLAIMSRREGIDFGIDIESDTAPLSNITAPLLAGVKTVRSMRDATRGGLASILNEIAEDSKVCIRVVEEAIPVSEAVRKGCELMGYDPLHIANEGKFVAVVAKEDADKALAIMRAHPLGRGAARIGEVAAGPAGVVILKTAFGGERVVDVPYGDMLPRIC
ncbi:MAG: hydrogenase expression/formation protein HypE [Candidatus Krumholzibacteria bacterium]|nr:hydrogenase expression/formation protein HypE [Candidatus Krumholzibacteria bacterium]